MRTNHIDPDTLRAALIGYQAERESIEGKIAEIRRQLGRSAPAGSVATPRGPRKKRTLSAAARKRIAAAQRKRWRAFKKAKAAR